jgi:hypothetical protein
MVNSEPCPICQSTPSRSGQESPFRPFCSERCKLVDLSRWLGEEYRVAGPSVGDGYGPSTEEDDAE